MRIEEMEAPEMMNADRARRQVEDEMSFEMQATEHQIVTDFGSDFGPVQLSDGAWTIQFFRNLHDAERARIRFARARVDAMRRGLPLPECTEPGYCAHCRRELSDPHGVTCEDCAHRGGMAA